MNHLAFLPPCRRLAVAAHRIHHAWKSASLLVLWTFLWVATRAVAAPALLEQTTLWTAGQDGYHTYRIPALLVTAKGSVLAFCEGRKTGSGDHGDVDLLMKRSTDGGRTWSPHAIVHEEGGDAKITIGNPCPVVDAKTGTLWLPFTRDNKAVLITSSTDDGKTWSTPRNLSATTMKPDWDWVATGPGIGIQLTRGAHKGRLVIPSDHKRTLSGKQLEWNSHMMFSDDGGATWQISTPISAGGNECQVIERTDGSLLVNTRMQGGWQGLRGSATSTDGGATWTAITQEKELPCPKCEASLLRYDDQRLLFSNPRPPDPKDGKPSGSRVRLTIRSSTDDGRTWPVARELHAGPSAYSTLARLPDGTILCLYETGDKGPYQSLRLARFNLDWLLVAAQPNPPQALLPESVKTLLIEANRASYPTNAFTNRIVGGSPRPQATNELVLRSLSRGLWPDFTQMKRVRLRVGRTEPGRLLEPTWTYEAPGDRQRLLSDTMNGGSVPSDARVEPVDFVAELNALLAAPVSPPTDAFGKPRLDTGHAESLLHRGIAAAWLGHTNQARQLFQLAIQASKPQRKVSDVAYRAIEANLKRLQSGTPWPAVLADWEKTLATYGPMGVPEQFEQAIEQLRQQLAEPQASNAKPSSRNPESLPSAERAAYYAERLHEQRPNNRADEAILREIEGLGRDAIPALIARLRDRRLTRLTNGLGELVNRFEIGGHYVFRVQDVALVLLERTGKVWFLEPGVVNYQPVRLPLSIRPPEERERLATTVEAWWAGVGGLEPKQWRFEGLNKLPLFSRVIEVRRLEQLAPKATNYLALLQGWTNEVRRPGPFPASLGSSQIALIRALAEHGDPSLIPHLSQEWQHGRFRELDLLLNFGSAEDIGRLRDKDRQRHLMDPGQLGSTYSFGLTQLLDASRNGRAIANRLLVPLLVDQLKHRQPSQTVRVQGEQWAKISRAEAAMQALMTLTGHDEGYSRTADFAERDAVVGRWEQWWNKAGEQVWLTLHPETRAAFGTSVTAPAVDNPAALPLLARVQAAHGDPEGFSLVPREQLAAQLRARTVEGRQLGDLTQFRFTSPAGAAKWFMQAKALPTTDRTLTITTSPTYGGQLTLRRPGLTTNAFLTPSLHVSSCLLAIGDSRGRAWVATLAAGTTTISRHEEGMWKTIFTLPVGPSGWSSEHEIQYALPLRDGALLLGIGRGDATRLHLLHGSEHLEFSNVEALFEREAPRLRKLVSYPPDSRERAVGLNPNLVLAKDSAGNLWWAKHGKCGRVGQTDRVTATSEDFDPSGRSGYFRWFSPLPQGTAVVAAESGQVRLLNVDGKRLRAGSPEPLPLPVSTETGKLWPRFLPGRNGGFWVSAKESVLFDPSLKRVTSQPGWLVLRDAKEVMWFLDYRHSQDADLIRRDKEGHVMKLHLRGLAGPPCEHGDGSVWISTDGGLARLVIRAGRLEAVEEALGVGVNDARMWRDPAGVLWVAEADSRRHQLVGYRLRQ